MRKLLVALSLCALGAVAAYAQAGDTASTSADVPHPTLPTCVQSDPGLLLPDLVPDPPTDVRLNTQQGRRVLRFTTAVGNVGDGPLVLEGRTISVPEGVYTQGYQIIWKRDGSQCARATGRFEYHPSHKHFHFDDFVEYELRSGDPITGPLAATGYKASFCLLDLESIRGYPAVRQVQNQTCASSEGIQGISVGWKDVYERFLPDQWIQLDADAEHQVPVGSYFLVNRADPDNLIWETDKDNNVSYTNANVSMSPPNLTGLPPPSTPSSRPPNIRPGHERPPRMRPTPRPRPTRPPRPPRGPHAQPTPTPPDSPTPTPTPGMGTGGSCESSCRYSVAQVRMNWYAATGLDFSASVSSSATCGPLSPQTGEAGGIRMTNFLTERRVDTGIQNITSFEMIDDIRGLTADNGAVAFTSTSGGSTRFRYTAPLPAPATIADRLNFPVVFDMCLTLGDQAVKMRLVCQGKPTGMLCHEG